MSGSKCSRSVLVFSALNYSRFGNNALFKVQCSVPIDLIKVIQYAWHTVPRHTVIVLYCADTKCSRTVLPPGRRFSQWRQTLLTLEIVIKHRTFQANLFSQKMETLSIGKPMNGSRCPVDSFSDIFKNFSPNAGPVCWSSGWIRNFSKPWEWLLPMVFHLNNCPLTDTSVWKENHKCTLRQTKQQYRHWPNFLTFASPYLPVFKKDEGSSRSNGIRPLSSSRKRICFI